MGLALNEETVASKEHQKIHQETELCKQDLSSIKSLLVFVRSFEFSELGNCGLKGYGGKSGAFKGLSFN